MNDQPTRKIIPTKIVKAEEPWCTYTLEDGSVVRCRLTIAHFNRVEGSWAPDGNPEYQIGLATQIVTDAPPALRRPQVKQASDETIENAARATASRIALK